MHHHVIEFKAMQATIRAILLMGGEGRRFKQSLPKQFHLLGDRKIYQYTLATFLKAGFFEQIILVCHPRWIEEVRSEVSSDQCRVIEGGSTRQASSFLGLQACDPTTDYVVIHDVVRPFISLEILERNISAVIQHKAVDTCIPLADTIVHTQSGDFISSIPPRKEYLRGQTPQTFQFDLIHHAHRVTQRSNATDDCILVHDLGHPIFIVMGEEKNIKITTDFDLKIAQSIDKTF